MKQVNALIREERADEVLQKLAEIGIVHATLTHVEAVGRHLDPDQSRLSMAFGRKVNRMLKVEIICPDRDEQKVVVTIREAACTGQPGDGVLSVTNVNRLVKIRDATESVEAL